jgi:hypothetical protein
MVQILGNVSIQIDLWEASLSPLVEGETQRRWAKRAFLTLKTPHTYPHELR